MSVTVETKKKREPLDVVPVLMLGLPIVIVVAALVVGVVFLILH